jgi:NTE family protein
MVNGMPENLTSATDRRTFSLALGSGGARGFAHVGVLDVLVRMGYLPSAIAGTSMGALVGALYAAGIAPGQMTEALELLDFKSAVSVTALNLGPESVLTADAFEGRLREVLPATFAGLQLPFVCVTADIVTGERVVMSDGDLPLAVRASMSIPVLYDPVRTDGRLLVDGGLVDPVPVDAARALGGDPVVAVDVGALLAVPTTAEEAAAIKGTKAVLTSDGRTTAIQIGTRSFDIASHWLGAAQIATAAVVVTPDVGGYSIGDFVDVPAIVGAGAAAAEKALPDLRAALATPEPESERGWFARLRRALGGRG